MDFVVDHFPAQMVSAMMTERARNPVRFREMKRNVAQIIDPAVLLRQYALSW
jgi:hypothetical protein